jgi:hypothetical protein
MRGTCHTPETMVNTGRKSPVTAVHDVKACIASVSLFSAKEGVSWNSLRKRVEGEALP